MNDSKSREDDEFACRIVTYLWIDSGTVIGVQELALGFIRRGFCFIFPCDLSYTTVIQSIVPTHLDQALLINIVCLYEIYLHSKDT